MILERIQEKIHIAEIHHPMSNKNSLFLLLVCLVAAGLTGYKLGEVQSEEHSDSLENYVSGKARTDVSSQPEVKDKVIQDKEDRSSSSEEKASSLIAVQEKINQIIEYANGDDFNIKKIKEHMKYLCSEGVSKVEDDLLIGLEEYNTSTRKFKIEEKGVYDLKRRLLGMYAFRKYFEKSIKFGNEDDKVKHAVMMQYIITKEKFSKSQMNKIKEMKANTGINFKNILTRYKTRIWAYYNNSLMKNPCKIN